VTNFLTHHNIYTAVFLQLVTHYNVYNATAV